MFPKYVDAELRCLACLGKNNDDLRGQKQRVIGVVNAVRCAGFLSKSSVPFFLRWMHIFDKAGNARPPEVGRARLFVRS